MCGYANVQMLKRLDILESFEVLKISKLFLFSGGCPILKYVVLYFICTFAYPHIRISAHPLAIRFIALLIRKLGLESAVVYVQML
jgi:hypothetical protein